MPDSGTAPDKSALAEEGSTLPQESPAAAHDADEKLDMSGRVALPAGLDSGDVVLFNRRCSSMSVKGAILCGISKAFSNSQWDHVGVVIRHPATGELLFLEADFGGVKLRSLQERMTRSKSNEIAVRRLSVVRNTSMRERFYAFAQEMIGRPYEISTGSMFSRISDPLAKQEKERLSALLLDKQAQMDEITKELTTAALTTFQRRLLTSELTRVRDTCAQIRQRLSKGHDVHPLLSSGPRDFDPRLRYSLPSNPKEGKDLSRVFCSELVAASYQRAGLLGAYPPAFRYTPKDFSSQQTHPPGVHLLKGARLNSEEYVRRSSRSPRELPPSPKKKLRGVVEGDMPSREARLVIRDALKRTPMYGLIPDEYKRNHLLKSFRARIVDAGDVVFEQGDYGNQFFIVHSGVVERFMQKAEEDPICVNTMGPRSSFGLTAFTFNTPRVSTVRAKERTLLWELDRPTFELFRDASSDVKSILSAVDDRKLRNIMKEHFLFKSLDNVGYNEVSAFFLVKFRAGETVFNQGDAGDNFYIIKSGELERHIHHPRRTSQTDPNYVPDENYDATLADTLKPGQSFGELSLMYNAPRSTTVRARTDAECWALSAESFNRLNLSTGTQHLRAVFNKNASVRRDGSTYMTRKDLLRFAGIDAFPESDRNRLAALLVALVACNRQRAAIGFNRNGIGNKDAGTQLSQGGMEVSVASKGDDAPSDDENEDVLMDFFEFVRFDIVLNQPSAEKVFAFRLADQNNSGFIALDEIEYLLQAYADVDGVARDLLSGKNPSLRKAFGRHGSRTLPAEEFFRLAETILPPMFVNDVKTVTQHMLNMDVSAQHALDEIDGEELAFLEPDGGLSIVGSQFMSSSPGAFSKMAPQSYSSYESQGLPKWLTGLDWGHLVSVGVSGAVSRTAVAPLERLKILMQTGTASAHAFGWRNSLRTMLQQEATTMRALFRGNGANVIRIVPSAAIQLIMVDRLRELDVMRTLKESSSQTGLAALLPEQNVATGTQARAVEAILIGGIAGIVAATATYPFDFVRARLSVQRNGFEPYRGTFHGIREAVRNEGFLSLYRGLGPSLAGVFPYVGLSFGIYETLRPILPKRNDETGIPTTGSTIVCGMAATATGQLAAFPLDTCRRRMQVAGFHSGGHIRATGFLGTWREIGRQMGWRGYFRGILPNLLKIAPASMVSFVTYERVRGALQANRS